MSTSKEGEEPTSKAVEQPTTISMTRRLQSFGSPDLEVTIGKSEKLYRYHSFLLASQSDYVDTILSSPAARNEQLRGRISFPDITTDTWEKMLKFLSPCEVQPSLKDMIELIPFYDKYQFSYGLKYCDRVLSKRLLRGNESWFDYSDRETFDKICKECCQLVSLIMPLNDFPLSKIAAAAWAAQSLKRFHSIDVEMMQTLMPLVENDESIIKSMVSTYFGRMCKDMSMNEMRDLIKQPEFPKMCITRGHQIECLDEQLRRMRIKNLTVSGCGDMVDGYYEYHESSEFKSEYGSEFAVTHEGGVMKGYWRKTHQLSSSVIIILESVDVFGTEWEIYSQTRSSNSDDEEASTNDEDSVINSKKVLLRWENNGVFNSLVPPKLGWTVVDESIPKVGDVWINYNF